MNSFTLPLISQGNNRKTTRRQQATHGQRVGSDRIHLQNHIVWDRKTLIPKGKVVEAVARAFNNPDGFYHVAISFGVWTDHQPQRRYECPHRTSSRSVPAFVTRKSESPTIIGRSPKLTVARRPGYP